MKKIFLITLLVLFPLTIFAKEKKQIEEKDFYYLREGTYERIELPNNVGKSSIVWESADSSIAKVDEDGVIEAKSSGETKITATFIDGTVKVYDVKVVSFLKYYSNIVLDFAKENWIVVVILAVLGIVFIIIKYS